MTEEDLAAALEAACAAVWNETHGDLMGEWPDACPNPQQWRAEERAALMPALDVLIERGALKPPTAHSPTQEDQ